MILDIVENTSGDVEKAGRSRASDDRGRTAVRSGNRARLAQRQHQKKEHECDQNVELSRKEKKRSTGSRSSEKSK